MQGDFLSLMDESQTLNSRLFSLVRLKRVKQLKPFLSETEIAVGISKSKQYLFTPSKTDIEELRRETTPWQTASMKE